MDTTRTNPGPIPTPGCVGISGQRGTPGVPGPRADGEPARSDCRRDSDASRQGCRARCRTIDAACAMEEAGRHGAAQWPPTKRTTPEILCRRCERCRSHPMYPKMWNAAEAVRSTRARRGMQDIRSASDNLRWLNGRWAAYWHR